MSAQAEALARRMPRPIGLEIVAPRIERSDEVLTPQALDLLESLHRKFDPRRVELLAARERRQALRDAGELPGFLPQTADLRAWGWRIAPPSQELPDRRIEIPGPADRPTIIDALDRPAVALIGDFDDSCSPTWENLIQGQASVADAIRRAGRHADPWTGSGYRLAANAARLTVQPRGWHLPEKHVRVDGEPVSGALFDVAVYLANNVEALACRGAAPSLRLPKLESHLEARLWNDILLAAQDALGLSRGTIRAAVLIETLPAAFEMEEILFELREHAIGLEWGRRNYAFSLIKTFRNRSDFLLPDRARGTLESRFLQSCLDLLVQTCHRRGAQALGSEHRPRAPRADVRVSPGDLIRLPEGEITEAGLRTCIRVGVQYLEAWLRGVGRVPLYDRMEDASRAEICRARLWQCLRHEARIGGGRVATQAWFDRALMEELDRIHEEVGPARLTAGVFPTATRVFSEIVKQDRFESFLTVPAYELLN